MIFQCSRLPGLSNKPRLLPTRSECNKAHQPRISRSQNLSRWGKRTGNKLSLSSTKIVLALIPWLILANMSFYTSIAVNALSCAKTYGPSGITTSEGSAGSSATRLSNACCGETLQTRSAMLTSPGKAQSCEVQAGIAS